MPKVVETYGLIRALISTLFCAGLTFFHLTAQPGNSSFKILSQEQGLSQSVVTCMFQDSRGFMWIGTQNGLNKFDGYRFTTYRNLASDSTSISGNYIRSISEDASGYLWIGTEKSGLNRFDRKYETFRKVDGPSTILSLESSAESKIWVGTREGIFQVKSSESPILEPVFMGNELANVTSVNDLLTDVDGNLWLATNKGLVHRKSNEEAFELYISPKTDSIGEVHALLQRKNGDLLIGTRKGILQLPSIQGAERSWKKLNFPNAEQALSGDINALAEDQKGHVWAGTFGSGLVEMELEDQKATVYLHDPNQPRSLSNDYILSLWVDRSGLLWVGTYGEGINQMELVTIRFSFFTQTSKEKQSLLSEEVYAVWEDVDKAIWVGTDAGLSRKDPDSPNFMHFRSEGNPDDLNGESVNAICQSEEGVIWVGTDQGLDYLCPDHYKKGKYLFQHVKDAVDDSPLEMNVLSLLEDTKGKLWVGTDAGLYQVDKQGKVLQHFTEGDRSINNDIVQAIFEDSNGNLWVGTEEGLNLLKPERKSFNRDAFPFDSLQNMAVLSLFEDINQNLWIGTDSKGLVRLGPNRKEIRVLTVNEGLPDNYIYGIIADAENDLWISTNRGLGKLQEQGLGENYTTTVFNSRNWLPCDAFNIGAYHSGASGTNYFGCNKGLAYFRLEDIQENEYVPQVVITDFQLFFDTVAISRDGSTPLSQHISETKRIVLEPNENVLYFEFAALSYTHIEKNQFSIRMEPFDKDWLYPKDKHSATYTNLDPGTYTFRVRAANNDGVWNEEGTSLEIQINPPIYQTVWFYLACIALLIMAIIGYIRWRVYSLEQNRRVLQQKVAERTLEVSRQKERLEEALDNLKETQSQLIESEKMASLGQLTAGVAHEINNPITFVSGNVNPLRRDISDVMSVLKKYEELVSEKGLDEEFQSVESLKKELDYEYLLDEIHKLIQGIEEGAERTTQIVKGLRNFSRLDEDDLKLANLHEGIESTLLILNNKMRDRIEVVKSYGDLPEIFCFPGKLNQVYMNILTNAIQAIEGEGKIFITTKKIGQRIHISIRDTGQGMPESVKKRIFDPFFTTKDVGAGTGLGLSITFGIIENHNGKITVDSEPGKGTTFLIDLPIRKKMEK